MKLLLLFMDTSARGVEHVETEIGPNRYTLKNFIPNLPHATWCLKKKGGEEVEESPRHLRRIRTEFFLFLITAPIETPMRPFITVPHDG